VPTLGVGTHSVKHAQRNAAFIYLTALVPARTFALTPTKRANSPHPRAYLRAEAT
jgi:hypothetical protein